MHSVPEAVRCCTGGRKRSKLKAKDNKERERHTDAITFQASLSGTFLPASAITSYSRDGAFLISTRRFAIAVSALREVW